MERKRAPTGSPVGALVCYIVRNMCGSRARSDWAPDPKNPLPAFATPRRVPHGVTLIGRLFDEGTMARVGLALERAAGVAKERPAGF